MRQDKTRTSHQDKAELLGVIVDCFGQPSMLLVSITLAQLDGSEGSQSLCLCNKHRTAACLSNDSNLSL